MQDLEEIGGPKQGQESNAAEQREVLLRVANGRTFHRSARLRDVLLYIGEHTLSGETAALTEQAIGHGVFGRPEEYNPAEDNIVRASVRQVRLKLKEYFQSEGRGERWILEIPKGGYVAAFVPRAVAPAQEGPAPSRPPAGPVESPQPGASHSRAVVALACCCAVLLAACLFLLIWRPVPEPAVEAPTLFDALLRQEPGPVRFVLTDSAVTVMSTITGDLVSVESYADQSYLQNWKPPIHDPGVLSFWTDLRRRQITSLADVLILTRVLQGNPGAVKRIEVRHAKHMLPRDFKSGNFIITGSRRSNPWSALFESQLNFQFDYVVGIRNLAPIRGEPSFFEQRTAEQADAARIAVVKNLSGTGFVLLIGGLGMEGTEGAGEFLLRNDSLPLIRKTLGLQPRDPLPSFEIVLGIKTLGGTARSAGIVAWRRH